MASHLTPLLCAGEGRAGLPLLKPLQSSLHLPALLSRLSQDAGSASRCACQLGPVGNLLLWGVLGPTPAEDGLGTDPPRAEAGHSDLQGLTLTQPAPELRVHTKTTPRSILDWRELWPPGYASDPSFSNSLGTAGSSYFCGN